MKMAGTGATFPSTPGAQRVLETSLLTPSSKFKAITRILQRILDSLQRKDKRCLETD
jgi:hypothetical protein